MISDLLKKEFDVKPVHNSKYIKVKIKIYNNKIDSSFHDNKTPDDNECWG